MSVFLRLQRSQFSNFYLQKLLNTKTYKSITKKPTKNTPKKKQQKILTSQQRILTHMAIPQLTPQGKQKLETELHHLKTTGRDEIAAFMEQVMEEGDISENSGYDDARAKMGALESRILELEDLLARAVIVEEASTDSISLGATVKLDQSVAGRNEFTIVGTHEVEPQKGRISDESPFGKVLLGKRTGDTVTMQGRDFKVLNIRYD